MQYRGVSYSVVQKLPTGFKWSIDTPKPKGGSTASRAEADFRARKEIDAWWSARRKNLQDGPEK